MTKQTTYTYITQYLEPYEQPHDNDLFHTHPTDNCNDRESTGGAVEDHGALMHHFGQADALQLLEIGSGI